MKTQTLMSGFNAYHLKSKKGISSTLLSEIGLNLGVMFDCRFGSFEVVGKLGNEFFCEEVKNSNNDQEFYFYNCGGIPFVDTVCVRRNIEFQLRGKTFVSGATVDRAVELPMIEYSLSEPPF